MGIPELVWYTEVETSLDSNVEGPYLFDEEEAWDGDDRETVKRFETFKFERTVGKVKKTGKVVARKISVSSSESDVDIKDVLEEVVRDYTATHSRSTLSC